MTGGDAKAGADGRPKGSGPRDRGDASLLTLLGLDPVEDAVYRLLVDRPESERGAFESLMDGTAVPALDSLVERGLASADRPDAEGTVRYRAASPVVALGPLLESRRSALHRVESLVGDLAERHRAAQLYGAGAPVEVLSGPAAIRRRLLTMQRQARTELCTLVPARHVPAVLSFEDNHEEVDAEMIERGVNVRSVVEREWLEDPHTASLLAHCVAQGQHISSPTSSRSSSPSWTGASPCCPWTRSARRSRWRSSSTARGCSPPWSRSSSSTSRRGGG